MITGNGGLLTCNSGGISMQFLLTITAHYQEVVRIEKLIKVKVLSCFTMKYTIPRREGELQIRYW